MRKLTLNHFLEDSTVLLPVKVVEKHKNSILVEREGLHAWLKSDTGCFSLPDNAVQAPSGEFELRPVKNQQEQTSVAQLPPHYEAQLLEAFAKADKAEGKAEAWKEAFLLNQGAKVVNNA